jgi:hypothetical protein
MLLIVRRVVGLLLTLSGVALTVVGTWFATQLGSDGAVRFSTVPSAGSRLVVLEPDLLNRVASPVTVTATARGAESVWIGRAAPSDAAAAVGKAKALTATGVTIRPWALLTATEGTAPAKALGQADLWREQTSAPEKVTLTVSQENAPETVVVQSPDADITVLEVSLARKTWFVEAVIGILVGVFLVVAGVLLLWPRRPHLPEGASA